jgi:hypothetical protein
MFEMIVSASPPEFTKDVIVVSVMGGVSFWRDSILSTLKLDESKIMGPKVFSNEDV